MPQLSVSVIDRTGNGVVDITVPDNFTPSDVMKAVEHKTGSMFTDEDDMWPEMDVETVNNMTIIRCHQMDMANWTLLYFV